MSEPTDKRKFCGAEKRETTSPLVFSHQYECGTHSDMRTSACYERQSEQQLAMLRKCLDDLEWCPGCDCDLLELPEPKHTPDCKLAAMLKEKG